MKAYFFLSFLLFAFFFVNAQTYTPIGDKVVISIEQETQEGGLVITQSAPIDSASAANRFFQTIIVTNQRIADLLVELDELRKQAQQSVKAYNALSADKNVNQRVADLYGAPLIGLYTYSADTVERKAEILINAQGRLVLRMASTNYPISVLSNNLFTVTNIVKDYPIEFIKRNDAVWVYAERGKKIVLKKNQ